MREWVTPFLEVIVVKWQIQQKMEEALKYGSCVNFVYAFFGFVFGDCRVGLRSELKHRHVESFGQLGKARQSTQWFAYSP